MLKTKNIIVWGAICLIVYSALFMSGVFVTNRLLKKHQDNRISQDTDAYVNLVRSKYEIDEYINNFCNDGYLLDRQLSTHVRLIYYDQLEYNFIVLIENGNPEVALFQSTMLNVKYIYGCGFYHPISYRLKSTEGDPGRISTNQLISISLEKDKLDSLLNAINTIISLDPGQVMNIGSIQRDLLEIKRFQTNELEIILDNGDN